MNIFDAIRNHDLTALHEIIAAEPASLQQTDERGSTPLLLASYLGQEDTTRALVEAGADLDVCGPTGTALMGVSFKGYPDLARYLLGAGADPEVRHPMAGATAIIFAAMFDRADLVDILLEYGADPTVKDAGGLTAADHAKQKGFTALAQKLSA